MFDVPDVSPDEEDEDDGDGGGGGADDDAGSDTEATISDLGKVRNLPNALHFHSEENKKNSTCKVYEHLRGTTTVFMHSLAVGTDTAKQLVYVTARIHRYSVLMGAVGAGAFATQEFLEAGGHTLLSCWGCRQQRSPHAQFRHRRHRRCRRR